LPGIISSAITGRSRSIAEIGKKINFDIVNVQEDFNYNRSLYWGGNSHPYRTKTKGRVPFGDGLNTLSHFPMTDVVRVPWKQRTGADFLTPKGFTLVQIEIVPEVWLDVYNAHANAQIAGKLQAHVEIISISYVIISGNIRAISRLLSWVILMYIIVFVMITCMILWIPQLWLTAGLSSKMEV
jgi:hypothetical protein